MRAIRPAPPRFGPRLDRFESTLGAAGRGIDSDGPQFELLARAAEATGDDLVVDGLAMLRDMDLPALHAHGLARRGRRFREIFRFPEPWHFEELDPAEAEGLLRFGEGGVVAAAPEGLAGYVDVPFCTTACRYCTTVGRNTKGDRAPVLAYLDAFAQEASRLRERIAGPLPPFVCLYVGGGTGSYLEIDELDRMLGVVETELGLSTSTPRTMEGSPISCPPEKVRGLVERGFDALSLGVESFEDHLLERCGRPHDGALAERRIVEAMDAGMAHTNADLILGLPLQTLADVAHTLETVARILPGAITLYSLRVHERTGFWRVADEEFPSAGVVYLMQAVARRYLAHIGYTRTEGTRWVLDPAHLHAQHVHTRRGDSGLSLGVRATSQVGSLMWSNTGNLNQYLRDVRAGHLPIHRVREIDPATRMLKDFILPLKLCTGVDRARFEARHGRTLEDVFGGELAELESLGLVAPSERGWVMTEGGALVETEALRHVIARAESKSAVA